MKYSIKTCTKRANRFTVTLTYLTCATRENIYTDHPHSFILSIQNRWGKYKLYTTLVIRVTVEYKWINTGQTGSLESDNRECQLTIGNINRNQWIYINYPAHRFGFPEVVDCILYEFLRQVWLKISVHHHLSSEKDIRLRILNTSVSSLLTTVLRICY